jgi:tetratricopeptide (TPR) repeat protein
MKHDEEPHRRGGAKKIRNAFFPFLCVTTSLWLIFSATAAAQVKNDPIAAHYQMGQAAVRAGNMAAARKAYQWFEDPPQQLMERWRARGADLFGDSAADATFTAMAFDRLYTLRGDYREHAQLHQAVLDLFVQAYDVIDRRYWPAHVAAGDFFVNHDRPIRAVKEYQAALKINPKATGAIAGLGGIALQQFSFDKVDQAVAGLRAIDPNSPAADRLSARNLIRQQKPGEAEVILKRLLQKEPNDLENLGLLASAQAAAFHPAEVKRTLERMKAIDPDNASAYFEVAEVLSLLRQYDRAEAMYKIAIARAPWWNGPRNGLGLLYTQSGDESAARTALRTAHQLDPYNLRTTNYLRLLDDMATMEHSAFPHFILIYNQKSDPIVPLYFPQALDGIYKKVCGDFRHEPKQTTMVEVFPAHDQFSVRTTGGAWIETVGASTGRVIAITAPRPDESGGHAFDWARVVRHEFTHTVTLEMTGNRIPHWLTEGLAVWEENGPIPWEWPPMLYKAATEARFFPLDQLTWGFVRPKKPADKQLAYAQSLWIVEYIEEKWGHEAMLKLLDQFRDGADVKAAFGAVLNQSPATFDPGFFAWAKHRVAGWGYDSQTTAKYDALCKKGTALIQSGEDEAALKVWEEARQLRPMDELPVQRVAGLCLRLKRTQAAIGELKALSRATQEQDAYARKVGELLLQEGQLDEAAKMADRAIEINLYDPAAHRLRLDIASRQKNDIAIGREQAALKWLQSR